MVWIARRDIFIVPDYMQTLLLRAMMVSSDMFKLIPDRFWRLIGNRLRYMIVLAVRERAFTG